MTQNNDFPLKFSVFFLFVRLEDWNQVCHLPYVWKNHHQVVWRNRVPKRVEIELAHSFNRPDVISSGPQDFRMSNCSKNYSITRQWKRDVPQKMPANIKVAEKTVFIKVSPDQASRTNISTPSWYVIKGGLDREENVSCRGGTEITRDRSRRMWTGVLFPSLRSLSLHCLLTPGFWWCLQETIRLAT